MINKSNLKIPCLFGREFFFVFNANFSFVNIKFRSTLFKGLWVWAEPIKSFHYNRLSGANSKAVAC